MFYLRKIKELKGYGFFRITNGMRVPASFLNKPTSYMVGMEVAKQHYATFLRIWKMEPLPVMIRPVL